MTHGCVSIVHKHVLCYTTKITLDLAAIVILFKKFKFADDTQPCISLHIDMYHFGEYLIIEFKMIKRLKYP